MVATRRAFAAGLLAFGATTATAQSAVAQSYPSRPVKLVVPYPPGGGNDIMARFIQPKLADQWGQPVVVENKPGAAGATATAEVGRATPDGYTLVLSGMGPIVTGPALNPHIGYDPIGGFTHIAMIAGDSTVFVVHPSLGAKTLADFVRIAKSSKNMSSGSSGVGTNAHLVLEQFKRKTGLLNITHVPYRGGGPLAADLLGNHVSAAFLATASAIELIRARKLIPLAVTTTERLATLKDVPTFIESGYPDVEATTWGWLSGPPHLPA